MIYVIDTHALVWFIEGSKNLGREAREIMRAAESSIVVPTIVLAEIKHLYNKKRIASVFTEVRELLDDDERVTIYPLDDTTLDYLPEGLEIHDAIICATCLALQDSLEEEVILITKDQEIIESKIIETTW
ncbi:MAG: PIN domain-containing protein [Actinobacteria bacterium]|nr:PIN domain-containing protein [Actinomycetota bacterium]